MKSVCSSEIKSQLKSLIFLSFLKVTHNTSQLTGNVFIVFENFQREWGGGGYYYLVKNELGLLFPLIQKREITLTRSFVQTTMYDTVFDLVDLDPKKFVFVT